MKKLFIPLIAFFILLGAIAYGSLSQEGFGFSKNIGETPVPQDIPQKNTQEHQDERESVVRDKIENIKKRLALKGLIIEGDTYYRNQEHTLALKKYLQFYKEHPSDPLIIEKIADTYHQTHKYKTALKYYTKIQDPSESLQIRIATLVLYTNDLNTQAGRAKARADINTIKLPDDIYFYYQNSITCIEDLGNCKFAFREYISSFYSLQQDQDEIRKIHPKIALVEQAFENFKNFKLEEEYLEDAYIIGALYTDKLYPISIILGEQLLEQKTGYKPILKIIAQSEYELGQYQKAKDILTRYYEADSNDPGVAYILGVINEKLGEYVLANIYLKKALKIGYTPSINVRRQLIHNYYLLKSDENMLRTFRELVEEEKNLEKEDLGLAIYHHIIQEDLQTAQKWSQKGQELFPESSNFYAYESWVLREKGEYDTALSVLQKGLGVESQNPFIILNIGYTLLEKGNPKRAKRYFTQAIDIAPESQFAIQARTELKKIETEERRQEEQKQEI